MVERNCFQSTFLNNNSTFGVYTCDNFEIGDPQAGVIIEETLLTSLTILNIFNQDDEDTKYEVENVPKFSIQRNDRMERLDLTGFHFIKDSSLTISNNKVLSTIDLSELISVSNRFVGGTPSTMKIENNPFLSSVKLTKLNEVTFFKFAMNKFVTDLDLGSLESALELRFGNNTLIADPVPVGPVPNPTPPLPPLPPLTDRRRGVAAEDCELLNKINLGNLTIVKGVLEFANLCKLTSLSMPNLETVNRDFILADLDINDIDLKKLTSVGGKLEIQRLLSDEVNFEELEQAGSVVLQQSHTITKALFPRLSKVEGPLTIYNNNLLTELNFDVLKSVEGDLRLENLEKLEFADLPILESVGPDLEGNYKQLTLRNTMVDMLKLGRIKELGFLLVERNEELKSITLGDQLSRLSNGMQIYYNDNLETVTMKPYFKGPLFGVVCEKEIKFELNDRLTSLNLNNLDTIQGNLTIYDNPVLQEINTNLQAVVGDKSFVTIQLNKEVHTLNFPYLNKIEGGSGRGFVTDLTTCLNNKIPHLLFDNIAKCDVADEDGLSGGAIFGILLAVFVGLSTVLAGGYCWGRRTSGGKTGYNSVN